MKWVKLCTAVVATLGTTSLAQAELIDLVRNLGGGKCCGYDDCCKPACCKPKIVKPCCPKVYTYQRACSKLKPPCCRKACAPKACCAPAPKPCCAPAPKPCAAPKPKAPCCAPAPKNCCAPAAKPCCAPTTCCKKVCCADPCAVAELIYQSQTACYPWQRRRAVHKLGDKYDCVCNPEIMCALVYALNDANPHVRAKAADEIGDQIRRNGCCCCSKEVVDALTCALGDCDWRVRREAQQALELCGYEVVDPCCEEAACDGCGAAPADLPKGGEATPTPAPAPPSDPKAYFPTRPLDRQTSRPAKPSRLSTLLGFLD